VADRGPNAGRVAYQSLAAFYDDFTAGYQAGTWTGRLEALAAAHDIPGRRLLDVGCGTGKSFLPMLERGWEVVGCDVSPAMLEIAREKVDDNVPLHVADVRELPTFGEFDLVWALNDTLNYLMSEAELQAALIGMRKNLGPGGKLLFDLNTLRTMREMFSADMVREVGGRKMSWTGRAPSDVGPGSTNEAHFEVAGDPSASHVHRERHFPEAAVQEAIEQAGLKFLEVWGDYEGEQDQPLDEGRHQKAIYIAGASGTPEESPNPQGTSSNPA